MMIFPFLAALGSEAPPADRAKDMDLYGWLIGSWEMDTIRHLADGATERSTGEIHFGWVLEGRAIQDVWPAAGFVDTEIRCLTELESGNAKKEVQPRVQA